MNCKAVQVPPPFTHCELLKIPIQLLLALTPAGVRGGQCIAIEVQDVEEVGQHPAMRPHLLHLLHHARHPVHVDVVGLLQSKAEAVQC